MSVKNDLRLFCRRGLLLFFAVLFFKSIINSFYFGFFMDAGGFQPIIGPDELGYYYKSQIIAYAIKEYGFLDVADNYYQYTGSRHFLFYFIVAPFFYTADPHLYFVLSKSIVYSFLCLYIYKTCEVVYNKRVALVAVVFFFLYVPVQVISLSFMRDDIMLFFMVGAVFYSIRGGGRKDYFMFFLFVVLLFSIRIHAAMALVAFNFAYNLNVKRKGGWKAVFISLAIALYIYYAGADFVSRFFDRVAVIDIIYSLPYEALRFAFSPIPTQVSPDLPAILPYWYAIGMMASLVGVFFVFRYAVERFDPRFFNSFFLLVAIYIIPYMGVEGLGFRQQSLVVSLIFAFIVVPAIMQSRSGRVSKASLSISDGPS